jgi:hypothetical protein
MTPASPEQERPDAATPLTPPSALECAGVRADDIPKSNLRYRECHTPHSKRSLPRRRCASAALLLGLSALLANLSGCANSFSGGGFPIGKSFVVGRVVSAENPHVVFKGVKIILLSTPPDGQSKRYDITTDANGNFQIPDVVTGEVSGAAQLTAASDDATIRGQSLFFSLVNKKKRGLLIALPKTTLNVSQATSLQIVPPTLVLPPGDSVQVNAVLKDANGEVLPIQPSLIYDADLGTIGSDGNFAGTNAGAGSITAQWYNNLNAVASVRVDPNAPSHPPPPPRFPLPSQAPGP